MSLRVLSAAAGVCAALAGVAMAQPIETIDFTVVWDKAEIAPGETNTGHVIATIGPAIGSIVAWNTAPGTGQAGKLMCFQSSTLDFVNVQNGLSGTIAWTVPSPLFNLGKLGDPDGNGGIKGSKTYQNWQSEPIPNFGQSLSVLDLEWTANGGGGGAYEVVYETNIQSAKVNLDVGLATWVGENAVYANGSGGFVVTPTPSGLAAMVVALGVVVGRRRREVCV